MHLWHWLIFGFIFCNQSYFSASLKSCNNVNFPECVEDCPEILAFKQDVQTKKINEATNELLEKVINSRKCGDPNDGRYCCPKTSVLKNKIGCSKFVEFISQNFFVDAR